VKKFGTLQEAVAVGVVQDLILFCPKRKLSVIVLSVHSPVEITNHVFEDDIINSGSAYT